MRRGVGRVHSARHLRCPRQGSSLRARAGLWPARRSDRGPHAGLRDTSHRAVGRGWGRGAQRVVDQRTPEALSLLTDPRICLHIRSRVHSTDDTIHVVNVTRRNYVTRARNINTPRAHKRGRATFPARRGHHLELYLIHSTFIYTSSAPTFLYISATVKISITIGPEVTKGCIL